MFYNWKNKNKEQIIREMALPDYDQKYLDEAIRFNAEKNDYSGMSLDRYILRKLDEEEEDDFNEDEAIFIKQYDE
ncbi:hypothetical protein [Bacillus sp. Marseille-P3800]|uniref:hypothetical protein n=1 Tax=Bacillus sp. Marseille-P3800 TaxID=2014782 RepID=UPI000C070787|nr:hypothetical protein [Bacillus sp. Marseille-P3800]